MSVDLITTLTAAYIFFILKPFLNASTGSFTVTVSEHRALDIADLSDSEIVQAIQNKDDRVFSAVVKKFYRSMYTATCAIVGPDRADEAIQEAWISVLKSIHSFQFKSALKTWVVTIAANHAKQLLRKEKKYINLEEDNIGDILSDRFDATGHWQRPLADWEQETPESLLLNSELSDCIEKNWDNLPDNYKTIINLREIEGLELTEICNILDLSSSNVRVLLHRAKNKLLTVVDHYRRTGKC